MEARMRKFVIGAALSLIAAPSLGGTLQWSITTGSDDCPVATAPAGATTTTFCAQIADADIQRIIADYQSGVPGYAKIQTGTDARGMAIMSDTTPQQVQQLIVEHAMSHMLDQARRAEQNAAAAGVASIAVTTK
jgi:hypothetical protein